MIDKENFRNNFRYYDKEIVAQVIEMFLEEYEGRFIELQKNIDDQDFEKIDHNAHSFKGVVTYMSPDLYELARILEFKGKEKDSSGLQETFDQLRNGTVELVSELAELLAEYQS
jgi:HPt (histidine-containing phosphotransfer) domain-containing protein